MREREGKSVVSDLKSIELSCVFLFPDLFCIALSNQNDFAFKKKSVFQKLA